MQFMFLWSGDIRGARKARIDGIESKGIVGHWRNGALFVPEPIAARAALPKRHHAAFDRSIHFNGLPQIWADARNNDAPLTMRLLTTRGKLMATYYFQPIA